MTILVSFFWKKCQFSMITRKIKIGIFFYSHSRSIQNIAHHIQSKKRGSFLKGMSFLCPSLWQGPYIWFDWRKMYLRDTYDVHMLITSPAFNPHPAFKKSIWTINTVPVFSTFVFPLEFFFTVFSNSMILKFLALMIEGCLVAGALRFLWSIFAGQ